ncbi:MAG: MAPEG family protein [Vibrionaceae bacterium]
MSTEQRGVASGIVAAILLSISFFCLAVIFEPIAIPATATIRFRLHLTAICLLALSLPQFICIARLAKHRFFTPEDINGSGLTIGTARAKLLQALLQNTIEQTLFSLCIYIACVFIFPAHFLILIPAAVVQFLLGRILFYLRYNEGASARALGFALTFYPTVFLGCFAIYFAIATHQV